MGTVDLPAGWDELAHLAEEGNDPKDVDRLRLKGQPFAPDEHARAILDRAAHLAPKIAGALTITRDAFPDRLY